MTDWITAGAAVASFFVAVALWRVTKAYTASTDRIAAANDRMAEANTELLGEMREDRRLAKRRRSEDAAGRLQVALATAERRWALADLSEEGPLRRIYNDWTLAVASDHNVVVSEAVRTDVNRFTSILLAAAIDWDAILGLVEDEHGAAEADLRRRRDNRKYRLNTAARLLRDVLGRHQRDEDYVQPRLPSHATSFWTLKSGSFDADFEAFM